MKAKTLKRFLITFSVIVAFSYVVILACAGGDWGWFGYSNFSPEPFADKSYSPLFYEPNEMFYGIGHDDSYANRFNDEITSEWLSYCGASLKKNQLQWFLLNDSSIKEISDLFAYQTSKQSNVSVNKWTGKINLQDQKFKDFIEFMYYAKKVENSSVSYYDPWNYEETAKPAKTDSKLTNQLLKKYQTVNDPFLKNRYWFQYSKALFYSDNPNNLIAFFNESKNNVPKNTLYYRVLSYVAGLYYKNKDFARANYFFSIVFDNCVQLRVVSAYNFHPQEESDWQKSLQMAVSNDEKAALWSLFGYYADTERAIEEIYKLNPNNKHLDYLLTRVVNKTEETSQTEIKESVSSYKSDLKKKIDSNVLRIVNEIANSEKTAKPYLWYMAAGYLQTLNSNFALASDFLGKAEKQIPNVKTMKDQLQILKLVNSLSELNKIDPATENILLNQLKWLYALPSKKDNDILRFDNAINWSKKYLSALYKTGNNIIMAELFNPDNVFYHDGEKLEAMKSFMMKSDKTPFENMAVTVYPYSIEDIYEFEAIINTFKNNIPYAYDCISKAGSLKEIQLLGNPFNGKIEDCHECDNLAVQKTKYSKYRFIEIIKIMQEKVEKGEDLFNNNLLLGNAFYNMSYYGNARFFYNNKLIGNYDNFYNDMIFSNSQARYYYEKALETASNDEQKAKCTYMLAKCERNDYYTQNGIDYDNYDGDSKPDFLAWKGFVDLKTKFSNTKYYQEVIKECGYFKSYLKLK